jgi:hypothetical protein
VAIVSKYVRLIGRLPEQSWYAVKKGRWPAVITKAVSHGYFSVLACPRYFQ